MATKATVYKAHLNVADMDRGYYADHALTLALHPSETEERMAVRLLAFALYADEQLTFTRGISTDDEPDLWAKDLTGDITRWIEVGQPDESRIRKACHRAREVIVVTFGARAAEPWWDKHQAGLARFHNLTVLRIPAEACESLTALVDRTMQWQVTIEDGTAFVSSANAQVEVQPLVWQKPGG